ncbi:MAG: hypothetical protein M1818_003747 [Claussenomyces sp. TS43310]|nr:MAG: hypothetical protein M1818_003747 [Claussenomyces sp. TS43310]
MSPSNLSPASSKAKAKAATKAEAAATVISHKRPYKKSTLGCRTCKARKVKCDEVRPVCGNCARRYVDIHACDYSVTAAIRESSASISDGFSPCPDCCIPAVQQGLSFKPYGMSGSFSSHRLELRLMHHYAESTCSLRARASSSRYTWEVDIPRAAVSSDVVLNIMLSISALHHLALTPADEELAQASTTFLHNALIKFQAVLPHLDGHNAELMVLSAMLIAHHSWLAAHSDIGEPHAHHTQTYRLCQGTKALEQRAPVPITARFVWYSADELNPPPRGSIKHGSFLDGALHDLRALSKTVSQEDAYYSDRDSYEGAMDQVCRMYHLIADPSIDESLIEQHFMTLPFRVTPRFLTLLEQDDPLASVLAARGFAVLALVRDTSAWWIHGAGNTKVCVKAIEDIHQRLPCDWRWAMEWPLKVIAGKITLGV